MNDLLTAWPAATGFVDAVIAITLVECALLAAWSRRSGFDFAALVPSLVSGVMLMLALRAAVGGAGFAWIALPVALSGLAHGWDLWRRFKTRPLRTARPARA